MLKSNSKNTIYKKYTPTMELQPTRHLEHSFSSTPAHPKYSTLQSQYSKAAYLKQTKSPTQQGAALDTFSPDRHYQSFQDEILRKVTGIEEEAHQLLEKKEREVYFLKIQLKNTESRLWEAEEKLSLRKNQNQKLANELEKVLKKEATFEKYHFLIEQNDKLKQSLQLMIEEKNQNWLYHQHKKDTNIQNQQLIQNLKKQVQELRMMVSQMQKLVQNCPSCFSLRRQIQQLSQSYTYLVNQHSQLKQKNQFKQKSLLDNITCKIQQNQNILRQNNHLKTETNPRHFYLKPKRQKIKESVAKRCRTLTDQF